MLNISSWRQIAIAISRRYLDKAFKESTMDGVEEDDDGVDDNPIDLQAGHGTHVAGMVYARELQQGLFSTATMRDKFRSVSRQWHRFLEFREGDSLAVAIRRKREPFETEREHHQLQRFRRLQQVDIAARLREMIGPDAAFRGQQETVIRAIMRGESPIMQIAGTGEGKSMSFMLPAYCSGDDGGTTIVIVPLVALRDDLHGRCAKSQIATYVWNSRGGHQITPIVFVTPESAVTKGFGDFVNRLQARKALDRVVVDECHTILDSTSQFRPQLMELGRVLNEWGVQKVFLTATLPPDEIGRFFEVVGLSASRVKVFRSRTTRPNIGYRVVVVRPAKRRDHHKQRQQQKQQNTSQTGSGEVGADQEAEDSHVVKIVQDWLYRNSQGRVIVYANTVDRVERLGRLSECNVFHSRVDTPEGKTQRLRWWIDQGRLIVATNALGLGVDVPDVRLVVHAGMPNRLRDYVQESGRAGRDGNHSEAVVVMCQQEEEAGDPRSSAKAGRRRKAAAAAASSRAKWPVKEAAVERFVSAKWCRRVVLDQVMDGQYDRAGCHAESEVACDVCQRQRDQLELEEDISWFERGGDMAIEAEARRVQESQEIEVEERFRRAQQNGRYEQFKARKDAMQVNEEAKMLEEELALMAGRCMGCFMATGKVEDDQFHPMEECPVRGARWWRQVRRCEEKWQQGMFKKGVMRDFSGCFWCGLPQYICTHWEAVGDDQGTYRLQRDRECQYAGLLVSVWGAASAWYQSDVNEVMGKMDVERQYDWQDADDQEIYEEGLMKWLGDKVQMGSLETSRFCQGFHDIIQLMIKQGGGRGDDEEAFRHCRNMRALRGSE
jgi:superfamily II DNA helicase RecQ